MAAHHHDHGCCETGPAVDEGFRRALWAALAINFTMFLVEVAAGFHAQSVSLQADALDFFGDSANYAISLFVLSMAAQWRSGAALFKGVAMGAFGIWVIGATIWSLVFEGRPHAFVMGSVGMLALIANLISAFLLYRFRQGDANMRSVWLCSRNDAIGNLAVMGAASGVFATGRNWPDLLVAAVMAGLALYASVKVIAHAIEEMRLVRGGAA